PKRQRTVSWARSGPIFVTRMKVKPGGRTMERREFLLGTMALGLTACAPSGPGVVTVLAQGVAGMNPGPDGADRPLTLTIVQLRSAGAFDSADFFALQNPQGALGGDLVKADQLALTPGAPKSLAIGLDASTT